MGRVNTNLRISAIAAANTNCFALMCYGEDATSCEFLPVALWAHVDEGDVPEIYGVGIENTMSGEMFLFEEISSFAGYFSSDKLPDDKEKLARCRVISRHNS